MRLVFAAKADEDLEALADYIAEGSPRNALVYVRALRAWCETLTAYPLRFPAAPGIGSGLRRAPYGNYLVFYSVHEDHLLIERVMHSARQLRPSELE